jgi:hypothetical protein
MASFLRAHKAKEPAICRAAPMTAKQVTAFRGAPKTESRPKRWDTPSQAVGQERPKRWDMQMPKCPKRWDMRTIPVSQAVGQI